MLGAQQLIETVYQLVSRSDAETLRFLRDVIVLAVHANPDGHELVANWYMREREPTLRTLAGLPRAYQKYIGHDNNRDFYMSSQAETINMNRILYKEWFPQIVYDHHQTGPAGTVMFAPPFRDPFNYVFDPLIPVRHRPGRRGHARPLRARGQARRDDEARRRTYSTWWNGGLRTTAYFHNQIGLLTESIGSPTPIEIPFVPDRQVPSADLPYPIAPQRWHFRQSIEYSVTANRAVLDAASRYRETLLFNIYRMGRNAIQRGSQDTWTFSPRRLAALRASTGARGTASVARVRAAAERRSLRDPRGYILPADQPDFLTATKFVDALLKTGMTVHRATRAFTVNGRTYPAGSFVVKTAQAFRPHVLDMFEPQDHPDDIPYPGGPPTPPYDSAGWTLAFQMGVKFDRVLDGFDGPFERVSAVSHPPGRVAGVEQPAGYLVSHHQNDAFIAVNRLLKAGEDVYWPGDRRIGGARRGTGAMYIAAPCGDTRRCSRRRPRIFGLTFTGVAAPPQGRALKLRPVRIGLWDRYGGSSSSGWMRWLFERFEFPFEVVYAQTLDARQSREPLRRDRPDQRRVAVARSRRRRPGRGRLPAEYRGTTGAISRARTLPQLKQFVEDGGTLIAIGDADVDRCRARTCRSRTALVATESDGTARPLTREQFYVPGSVAAGARGQHDAARLRVRARGRRLLRATARSSVSMPTRRRRVAWFMGAVAAAQRMGAGGSAFLEGGVAVVDAQLGRGRVLLFGPEITFRAQSHGTFKFLFNAIYYGKAVGRSLARMP